MRNFNNPDVISVGFGFTSLTRRVITKYIGTMYEDAAEFSDESISREYYFLKDSGNLQDLFEGYGMVGLGKRLIKNYLGNIYQDAADYSDESVRREYHYLKDAERLHEFFECDWLFSEEIWA